MEKFAFLEVFDKIIYIYPYAAAHT
jgi:hypothetical protein